MTQRKLAAIMFTDIVGYTALMGSDEDRAFEVLRNNREIHTKFISQFHGTLIKEMGDGMLISFDLASEAVRCAIEIQKACKAQNIPLKIGIHEGEMVFEGNDVLGDGVNVAARIQDGAEEGCILISGSVFRDIKNKADIQTEFIGEKQFKNVDEKIRIYRVNCGEEIQNSNNQTSNQQSGKSQNSDSKKRKVLFSSIGFLVIISASVLVWIFSLSEDGETLEKSIAFLPLKYLSDDQSKQLQAYRVRDAITGHLSEIDCLIVRPTQSVDRFRDTNKSTQVIGEELAVSYLIRGIFFVDENQPKLSLQLINARDDEQIFYKEYSLEMKDIMKVAIEVAQTIAKKINVEISPEAREIIEAFPTNDKKAYDLYIQGSYELGLYWRTYDGIHLKNSNDLLDQALKIDSNYVDALQAKAVVIQKLTSDDLDSMNYWADKALKIDPDHPQANYRKAEYYRQTGKFDLAITYYQKSLQFNPDSRQVNMWLGRIYCLQKRDVRKGYPYLMKAIGSIDKPRGNLPWLASTFSALGEYEKAELILKAAMKSRFNDCDLLIGYQGFLMTIGNYDRALHVTDSICPSVDCDWQCNDQPITLYAYRNELSTAEQYIKKWEDQRGKQVFTISKGYVYHKMGRIKEAEEVFQEVLKRNAKRLSSTSRPPDVNYYFWRAQILAFQNRKSEALQSIKMIDEMALNFDLFDSMTHDPMFENLREDPEFKAILKKVQDEKASVRAQIREMEEQAKFDM